MINLTQPPMVYLFVCGSAEQRSPMATRIAKELVEREKLNITPYYAGLGLMNVFCNIMHGFPLVMSDYEGKTQDPTSKEDYEGKRYYHQRKIDEIFVMESHMEDMISGAITMTERKEILLKYPNRIICLDVPSGISHSKEILRKTLTSKIEGHFKTLV